VDTFTDQASVCNPAAAHKVPCARPGRLLPALLLGAVALVLARSEVSRAQPDAPTAPAPATVEHVIVVYLENRTVDHLYSGLAGVDGIFSPGGRVPQVDRNGKVYPTLPRALFSLTYQGLGAPVDALPGLPDPRFPTGLPNEPFAIEPYVPLNHLVGTPVHRFYEHQLQMNGGKMDKFVAWSDSGALVMGTFDTTKLPLYPYARDYTFADHFFTAAFGGSWLNHMWLVCACTPRWENAPAEFVSKPIYDDAGNLVGIDDNERALVTPDGYVVNTQPESFYPPFTAGVPDDRRMPPSPLPTIGERLTGAGVSWAEFNGGWTDALAGHDDQPLPFVNMPPLSSFVYFEPYGPDSAARAEHVKDETDFIPTLIDGTLPAVSIVKPADAFQEHPGYSNVVEAENHVVELIEAVRLSRFWDSSVIFVTYDDFGGWYDHVAPPTGDRWGPGGRVPMLIISPLAKKGFVDHTFYDTTSILSFIEARWNLDPLTVRDQRADPFTNAFPEPVAVRPAGATPAPVAADLLTPPMQPAAARPLPWNIVRAVGLLVVGIAFVWRWRRGRRR